MGWFFQRSYAAFEPGLRHKPVLCTRSVSHDSGSTANSTQDERCRDLVGSFMDYIHEARGFGVRILF